MDTTYCEHPISEVCKSNREILSKVYNHALENRPKTTLSYRPKTEHPYVDMVGAPGADLRSFYPDAKEGDFAYFAACMDGMFERNMLFNLRNCGNAVMYFNGEKMESVLREDGTIDVPVIFRKGRNRILLRVTAVNDSFGAVILPMIPELRMSPGMYVYSSWMYLDTEGFHGQAGVKISRLYRSGEAVPNPSEEAIDWAFPVMPEQSNEKSFDFDLMCGKGKAAFAYTYVCGKIAISHRSPLKIFSGGEEIYCAEKGEFCGSYSEPTELLIKAVRTDEAWGFSARTEGEHSLPFVDGADCADLQWLWIGCFGRETDPVWVKYAPESKLQFDEPYPSVCGQVYWRFYRENTYLKQYMQSAFFGQWFYPLMVGANGLRLAAQRLDDSSFDEIFCEWMSLLCRHRNYGRFDTANTGWASYLAVSSKLDRLDPIGTIGINIAEYYMITGDDKAQYLLQLLADSMSYNVPRFEDGTFYRIETMWTDDMYMCLPFLVRLGAVTGEERYFDDALTQVRGFYNRLYMEEEGLFSHIHFVREDKRNCVPWGRGNGWVLLALSELLLLLPEDYHGREEILEVYRKFARGVLAHRDKEGGIWHQVINNPESYLETSGSAMFITALARGVRCGWIEDCSKDITDAWASLCQRCIDSEGNVYGVCKGSGCNMEEKYYLDLGTIVNDDHGVGIVLGACSEVMNLLGE